jgi:hypothetical protein
MPLIMRISDTVSALHFVQLIALETHLMKFRRMKN